MITLNPFIGDLSQNLTRSRLVRPGDIVGCTMEEVEALEFLFYLKLPAVYKEFLLVFGRRAGNFLRGTDCFFQHLPPLQLQAEAIAKESGGRFILPDTAYVFAIHQGYKVFYFDLANEDDDPPVYFYQDDLSAPIVKWTSFTEFLQSVFYR